MAIEDVLWDIGGAVFNVKAYGASGEYDPNADPDLNSSLPPGTPAQPDDTGAFEQARDDAVAVGGIVFVPAGSYRISRLLELGGTGESGLTWQGAASLRYGAQSLVFVTDSEARAALRVTAPSTTIRGIAVLNRGSSTIGVDVRDHFNCVFERVLVQGFSQSQFRCGATVAGRGSFWGRWRDCTIQTSPQPAESEPQNLPAPTEGAYGIHSTGNFNNCVIDSCIFIAGDLQYWEAIRVENTETPTPTSTGSVIQNCDFGGGVDTGSRHAIVLEDGCQGFSVINNRHESYGLRFLRQADGAQGLWLSGNQLAGGVPQTDPPPEDVLTRYNPEVGPAEMLVRIEGADVEIGHNHLSNATYGIYVETGAQRVLVHPQAVGGSVTTPVQNASTGTVTVLQHGSAGWSVDADVILARPDRFLRGRRAGGQVERLVGIGSGDVVYLGAMDAITRTVVRAGGADHLTLETNKLGLFGVAPATRQAYTVSGSALPLRSLNSSTATAQQVREVLATLISDLKSYGLLG
ncbi:MAG TPA: hypothetical protein VE871_01675 [Longimicrobium sp.]|nr:hypothetical protein [Longimicrobium sp.]